MRLGSARARAGCLAALLCALSGTLSGEDLPPAPEGFSWKRIESVKASFLMPTGWHFKEEEKKGTRAFFITREDIDSTGRFETGLTVNVQKFKKDKATAKAAEFVVAMMRPNEVLDKWTTEAGALKAFGCRVRETEKDHPPLIIHLLAIGNEKTNTLYLILFESPEKSWDEAWAKGQVILDKFFLDDEI